MVMAADLAEIVLSMCVCMDGWMNGCGYYIEIEGPHSMTEKNNEPRRLRVGL